MCEGNFTEMDLFNAQAQAHEQGKRHGQIQELTRFHKIIISYKKDLKLLFNLVSTSKREKYSVTCELDFLRELEKQLKKRLKELGAKP